MSFRVWYYTCRVLVPIVFGTILFGLLFPGPWVTPFVFRPVLYVLVTLGCVGGAMGVLMVLGRLRMLCPFCTAYGLAKRNKSGGIWLECKEGGIVRGTGLRMIRHSDHRD
jgi:hypothetical protein